ncbi:MAG: TOBE domain-containing protein, partial [Nocardioides sp.]
GTVTELTFHGARTHALVECPALGSGIRVDAELPNDAGALPEWLRPGDPVSVELAADALRLLPVTAR